MSARQRHRRIGRALGGASLIGWSLIVLADISPVLPRLCSASGWDIVDHASAAASFNSLSPIAIVYFAMLVAMMIPLLAAPLREISDRSVPARRPIAMAIFVSSYAIPWLLVAPLFGLSIIWIETAFAADSIWPKVLPAALALGWHMTAARQFALNVCHRHLNCFVGSSGDYPGVVIEGVRHGVTCLAACSPLMFWAMTLQNAHLAAMAIVAVFLWAERQMPPNPLRWGSGNFFRTARSLSYYAGHLMRQAGMRTTHD